MAGITSSPLHDSVDTAQHTAPTLAGQDPEQLSLWYLFVPHEHPFATELASRLIAGSVPALQDADTATAPNSPGIPALQRTLVDDLHYGPAPLLARPYPMATLDFDPDGAYGGYNWELFFHLPLTVATHLSANGRYEEAQRWLHYIFDPTDDSDGPTPQRFWRFRPFQTTDIALITTILTNLSSGADPGLQEQTRRAIRAWQAAPFSPHAVARGRPSAYMLKTVMAYLDNLIAWGDSLFAEGTGESINEATQLYVLAANVLGPQPQQVPRKGSVAAQSYADLRADLNEFGDALRELEADLPFDLVDAAPAAPRDGTASLGGLSTLYFCIPYNDKLLGYWDAVANRLFKIRNSLNLQGLFQQLPLFEPPIDPGVLARAAAAGVDVAAVIGGLNAPLPLVRFQLLAAKATEICAEVKALGAQLLSALEKQDAEHLTLLRQRHESAVLGLTRQVRYAQYQEARKSREGVQRSLSITVARYRYFEMLLGKQPADIQIPELDGLATDQLGTESFGQSEPTMPPRDLQIVEAQDPQSLGGGHKLNTSELQELSELGESATFTSLATVAEVLGAVVRLIPTFAVMASPFGVGGKVQISGEQLSALTTAAAAAARQMAYDHTHNANTAARLAGYERREQDWSLQSDIAAGEISAALTSLRAAQLREEVARQEWTLVQKQIEQADEIEQFLTDERTGKRTNEDFYIWLSRETRRLYGQCFQFALDVARKAERALQQELGDPGQHFLQSTYLAGKEGLLAGEKLALDLKRMEVAYSDLNRREHELMKHVSLRQLDPLALLQLRATGSCTVALPEELFDLDCPGHYFRRIKTVAVSIPCVVGPYSSVHCTLTQLRNSIRIGPQATPYARGDDDVRFEDSFGGAEGIVTSTGQSDSGLFETNLRDERYLPFENSGAISSWRIELPAAIGPDAMPQFDLDTIADVILHLRYTARDGGEPLRAAALHTVRGKVEAAATVGSVVLLSARHDFPTEWARFQGVQLGAQTPTAALTLPLRQEHYPFWSRNVTLTVRQVDVIVQPSPATPAAIAISDTAGSSMGSLVRPADGSMGPLLVGTYASPAGSPEHAPPQPPATEPLTLAMDDNSMTDVWVAITWGGPE